IPEPGGSADQLRLWCGFTPRPVAGGASMSDNRHSHRKSHVLAERPPFERIALLLQGGGALGSYQAGVYQALAEANLQPDWIAAIRCGGITPAWIAGNPPGQRVERPRDFWEGVTPPPFGIPDWRPAYFEGEFTHTLVNQVRSLGALLGGAPGFFKPRV